MRYSILFTFLISYLVLTWCQPPPGPDTTGGGPQPPQPPDQTTSRPEPPQPPDQTTGRPQPPDQTTSRPQPPDQTTSRPQPPDQTGTGCTVDTADLVAGVLSCPCSAENTANCDALQAQHGADLRNIMEGEVIVCDKDEGHCTITCTEGADQCDTVQGLVPGTTLQCVHDGTTLVCTGDSAQPPDQTGAGGPCSFSNIAACTCVYPSDMSNCDILQDAFDPFGYDVDCVHGLSHCTLACNQTHSDCTVLAAGGFESECDGEFCVPRTETTFNPQSTEQTGTTTLCNSIQFGPYPFLLPEYVCFGEKINNVETSKNYVCDEQGGAIMNMWDNFDCFGTPTRTEDPCYDETLDEIESECSYTAYCGGEICTYVAIEQWENVSECDGDIPATNAFTNHTSGGLVFPLDIDTCANYCVASESECAACANDVYQCAEIESTMYQCTASGVMSSFWSGADCVGDPVSGHLIIANFCFVTTSDENGDASAVDCNAVATKPPTAAPTQNTESPTTSPSTSTTVTIAGDDDDDGDDTGSGAYGVKVSSFMTLFAVSLYFIAN